MIRKFFPPGARIEWEIPLYSLMFGFCIGGELSFFILFWNKHAELYDTHAGIRILHPGRLMPTLTSLVSGLLLWFWVLAFGCIGLAILHYASFYRESRSIYVMKRVPSRAELHVRCLTFPVLTIVIALIVSYVLFRICVWYYFRHTPEPCIPDHVIPSFWRVLL